MFTSSINLFYPVNLILRTINTIPSIALSHCHNRHHANDQSQGQEHGEAALDEIVFVHFHIKFFLSLLGFRMQRIRRQGCHSRSFLWRPP